MLSKFFLLLVVHTFFNFGRCFTHFDVCACLRTRLLYKHWQDRSAQDGDMDDSLVKRAGEKNIEEQHQLVRVIRGHIYI